MNKKLVGVVLAAFMCVGFIAEPCWACSCAFFEDTQKNREAHARSTDVIFTGVVTKVETEQPRETSPVASRYARTSGWRRRTRAGLGSR